MGWGGGGALTFLAHHFHLLAHLWRVGVGWDGVGWGAITFVAHHFHALAHCIHVLVSMGGGAGVGWGGVSQRSLHITSTHLLGVGWGAITFLAHHFHLLATASMSLVSIGGVGVGWGGVRWISSSATPAT